MILRALLIWLLAWCVPLGILAYPFLTAQDLYDGVMPIVGLHRIAGWLLMAVLGLVASIDRLRLNRRAPRRESQRLILFFHILSALICVLLVYSGIRFADLIAVWNAKPGGLTFQFGSHAELLWVAFRSTALWILPGVAGVMAFHRVGSSMAKKSEQMK